MIHLAILLAALCANPIASVKDFGATGSATTLTCNTVANSAVLNCLSVGDFVVGQPVRLYRGGYFQSLATPAAPTVAPACSGAGCLLPVGSIMSTYALAASDGNGVLSSAGPAATFTGGTLHGGGPTKQFNHLTWPAVSNASFYVVYKNGAIFDLAYANAYDDYGQVAILSQDLPQFPATPGSAQAADLITTIVSVAGNNITLAQSSWITASGLVLEHDDRAAFQAAVNAGGAIQIPVGTYNIDVCQNANFGAGYGVDVSRASGLRLCSQCGAYIVAKTCAGNYKGGNFTGSYLFPTAPPTNWATTSYVNQTVYPLSGAQPKDTLSVALLNTVDASHFVPGDYVFIRTGLVGGGPDSEINQVASVSGATLYLRFPLTKTYRQEYYEVGISGDTSTTPTANPAPFGIANVTAYTARDEAFVGLNITTDIGTSVFAGGQIVGQKLRWSKIRSGAVGMGGNARFTEISRNNITDTWNDAWGSYGMTDVLVRNNAYFGVNSFNIQAAEGTANLVAYHNRIATSEVFNATWLNVIASRGRCYNISLIGNWFINDSGDNIVRTDGPTGTQPGCFGVTLIDNDFFSMNPSIHAAGVGGSGVTVSNNSVRGALQPIVAGNNGVTVPDRGSYQDYNQ